MPAETKKLTLATLKGGAAEELFQRELARVLENIRDPNTDAKKARTITLDFSFLPVEDRNGARRETAVVIDSKCKLVPVIGVGSFAFIASEGGELIAYTNDVEQESLELVDRTTGEVTDIRRNRGA